MSLTFLQDTTLEQWRAKTLTTKEPGTIAWLDELREGDVFYDVGANIGIYTMYAASKVGPTGHVYAIEPHLANAVSLLKNIEANSFQDRVTVACVALSYECGWAEFHYSNLKAGASGSQIHEAVDERGNAFQSVMREYKRTETLENLSRPWRAPSAIKVDVDGHEDMILTGALSMRPLSWQVEVHPRSANAIAGWLRGIGYVFSSMHYTSSGQKAIDRGAEPASVTSNVIYRKAAR